MTPQQTLKELDRYLKSMQEMKSKHVAVGVLGQDAGETYEDGATLGQIAAIHEYGRGQNPERSFLRMPQELKRKDIASFIELRFNKVLAGESVDRALGLIGLYAVNISKEAFSTGGFGNWPALSSYTIAQKKSSKVLVDTGRLMNSVHSEVRKN